MRDAFLRRILPILALLALALGAVGLPASADHSVDTADHITDSRCDNHTCVRIRLNDSLAAGGNPLNVLHTAEGTGGATRADRLL